MSKTKQLIGVHGHGSKHWVGDGFPVRNLFPSNGVRQLSPFLMLDYAGPTDFEPSDKPRGVEEHPHRGFETVTIAYQGAVDHRDSAGNSGTIYPGDVQWMTAGSGVVHEEKHERAFTKAGGVFEMIQLWVNLPKIHKMTGPGYQAITASEIPVVTFGEGTFARIIAGELNGVQGPAKTFTPVNMFDLRLAEGGTAELQLTEGHTAAIVLLRGGIKVNGGSAHGPAQLVVLSREGTTITIQGVEESVALVLSGEPIEEPVASYGPFVMNTQDEIRQAIDDYQTGKMGHLEATA